MNFAYSFVSHSDYLLAQQKNCAWEQFQRRHILHHRTTYSILCANTTVPASLPSHRQSSGMLRGHLWKYRERRGGDFSKPVLSTQSPAVLKSLRVTRNSRRQRCLGTTVRPDETTGTSSGTKTHALIHVCHMALRGADRGLGIGKPQAPGTPVVLNVVH